MIVIKWILGAFRYFLGAVFGIIFDVVVIARELFTLFEEEGKQAPSFKGGFDSTRGSVSSIVDDIRDELKQ